MKRSQRLEAIVDLNRKNEKKALEALGLAQVEKNKALKQREGLQRYKQEYIEKYQTVSAAGIHIVRLLDFRAFVEKVDTAIESQEKIGLEREYDISLARKEWETQYKKTKSIKNVQSAAAWEEMKIENKQEQREQDDRAALLNRYNQ